MCWGDVIRWDEGNADELSKEKQSSAYKWCQHGISITSASLIDFVIERDDISVENYVESMLVEEIEALWKEKELN